MKQRKRMISVIAVIMAVLMLLSLLHILVRLLNRDARVPRRIVYKLQKQLFKHL